MSVLANMKRRDHLVIFPLPEEWNGQPDHIAQGLIWWRLLEGLIEDRLVGKFQAITAPYDTSIAIARNEDELRDVLSSSGSELEITRAALERLNGRTKAIAVCRFACDEPSDQT